MSHIMDLHEVQAKGFGNKEFCISVSFICIYVYANVHVYMCISLQERSEPWSSSSEFRIPKHPAPSQTMQLPPHQIQLMT